jgi:hypothetical protein
MFKNWAAWHWAAHGTGPHMALGRTWHWAARHWADFFPGRGRFGTLLSHPALLLATGNRGLGLKRKASEAGEAVEGLVKKAARADAGPFYPEDEDSDQRGQRA